MKIENNVDMFFNKRIAKKYSIMAALVLNRILWSLTLHQNDPHNKDYARFFIDGQWWMKNTYEALATYFDGLISKRTIREIVLKFESDGILISRQMEAKRWHHEKWYTVDLELCAKLQGIAVTEKAKKPMIIDGAKNVPSVSIDGTVACPIDEPREGTIHGATATPSSSIKSHSKSQNTTSEGSAPTAGVCSLLHMNPARTIRPGHESIEGKGRRKGKSEAKFEPEDLALGKEWLTFATSRVGNKGYGSWTEEKFAVEFKKIRENTQYDHVRLREILEFLKVNDFWGKNALSPARLLVVSERNELTKIDNIWQAVLAQPKFKTMREYAKTEEIIKEYDVTKLPF